MIERTTIGRIALKLTSALSIALSIASQATTPTHVAPPPRAQPANPNCAVRPALHMDSDAVERLLTNYKECFPAPESLDAFLGTFSLNALNELRGTLRHLEWNRSHQISPREFDDLVAERLARPLFLSRAYVRSLSNNSERSRFRAPELAARLATLKKMLEEVGEGDPELTKSLSEERRLLQLAIAVVKREVETEKGDPKSPFSADEFQFIRRFPRLSEAEKRAWVATKPIQDLHAFDLALNTKHYAPQNLPPKEWTEYRNATSDFLRGVLRDPLWVYPSYLRALKDDAQFKELDVSEVDGLHGKWLKRYIELDTQQAAAKDLKVRGEQQAEQKVIRELLAAIAKRRPWITSELPNLPAVSLLHDLQSDPLAFQKKVGALPIEDRIDLLRDLRLLDIAWGQKQIQFQWIGFNHAIALTEAQLPPEHRKVEAWKRQELTHQRQVRFTESQSSALHLCEDTTLSPLSRTLLAQASLESGRERIRKIDERLIAFGGRNPEHDWLHALSPNQTHEGLEAFADSLTILSRNEVENRIAVLQSEIHGGGKTVFPIHLEIARAALRYRTQFHEFQDRLDFTPATLEAWASRIPPAQRKPLLDFLYFAEKEGRALERLGCPTQGANLLQNARRKLLVKEAGLDPLEQRFVDTVWRMQDPGIHALVLGAGVLPDKDSKENEILLVPLLMHLETVREGLREKSGHLPDADIDRPMRAAGDALVTVYTPILKEIEEAIAQKDGARLEKLRARLAETGLWSAGRAIALEEAPVGEIVSAKLKKFFADHADAFNAMSVLLAKGRPRAFADQAKKSVVLKTNDGTRIFTFEEYQKEVKAELSKFAKLIELHQKYSTDGSDVTGLFLEYFGRLPHFDNNHKSDAQKKKDALQKVLLDAQARMRDLGISDDLLKDLSSLHLAALNADSATLTRAAKDAPYFAAALGAVVVTLPFSFASLPASAGGFVARLVIPPLVGATVAGGTSFARQKAEIADGVSGRRQVNRNEVLRHAGIGAGVGLTLSNTGKVGIVGARLLAIVSFADASGNVAAHLDEGRKNEAVVDVATAGLSLWALSRSLPGKASERRPGERLRPWEPEAPPKFPDAYSRPGLSEGPTGFGKPNPPNITLSGGGGGVSKHSLFRNAPEQTYQNLTGSVKSSTRGGGSKTATLEAPSIGSQKPPLEIELLPKTPGTPLRHTGIERQAVTPAAKIEFEIPLPGKFPASEISPPVKGVAVAPIRSALGPEVPPPPPPDGRRGFFVVWDEEDGVYRAYSSDDGDTFYEYDNGRWYRRTESSNRHAFRRLFGRIRRYLWNPKTQKYVEVELKEQIQALGTKISANQQHLHDAIEDLKKRFSDFNIHAMTSAQKEALRQALAGKGVPKHDIDEMLQAFSPIIFAHLPKSTYYIPGVKPMKPNLDAVTQQRLDAIHKELGIDQLIREERAVPEAQLKNAKQARFDLAQTVLKTHGKPLLTDNPQTVDAIWETHRAKGIFQKARLALSNADVRALGMDNLRLLFQNRVLGSDGDALYAAILAHPFEDTPRLIYADWLEEHATTESERARAHFIRLQIQYAQTPEFLNGSDGTFTVNPEYTNLRTEATKLYKAHVNSWTPPELRALQARGMRFRFDRGFVSSVSLGWDSLINSDGALNGYPITELRLNLGPYPGSALLVWWPDLEAKTWGPEFASRLDTLRINNPPGSTIISLGHAKHLKNLRHLTFDHAYDLEDGTTLPLVRNLNLTKLERLAFVNGDTPLGLVFPLSNSPYMKHLKSLRIDNLNGNAAADVLAKSKNLPSLVEFETYSAIGEAPLKRLHEFFERNRLNRSVVAQIPVLQHDATQKEMLARRAKWENPAMFAKLDAAAKLARFHFSQAVMLSHTGILIPETQDVIDALYAANLEKDMHTKGRRLLRSPTLSKLGLEKLRPLLDE